MIIKITSVPEINIYVAEMKHNTLSVVPEPGKARKFTSEKQAEDVIDILKRKFRLKSKIVYYGK